MPIVVAILAVIIVGLGAALFLIPNEKTPVSNSAPVNETVVEGTAQANNETTPITPTPASGTKVEDANRTEEMQAVEEMMVKNDPAPTPEVATPAATYTENVSYLTPARTEHKMAVTLSVADGVVTDASVTYDGKSTGFSSPHHERFNAAYKTEVVGKKLSEVSLSRVGGASLTSKAFNDAVAKIVAEQA